MRRGNNEILHKYSRTLAKDHLDQETALLLRPFFTSPNQIQIHTICANETLCCPKKKVMKSKTAYSVLLVEEHGVFMSFWVCLLLSGRGSVNHRQT